MKILILEALLLGAIISCTPITTYQPLTADQVMNNNHWLQNNQDPTYRKHEMLKYALNELDIGIDIHLMNNFVNEEEGTQLIKLFNLANYYVTTGRVAILELKFETATLLLDKAHVYIIEGLKKIHEYAIRERDNSIQKDFEWKGGLQWNYL